MISGNRIRFMSSQGNNHEQRKTVVIRKPELMAPAGDRTMLTAAVQNGADAVYFGIDKLNMRAKADNFTLRQLPAIVKYCHDHKVNAYLTLNTIVYEHELKSLDRIIIAAKKAGIDMIIAWDLAVIERCKKHKIPFCVSTQASLSNSDALKFMKKIRARRVVLARECSLKDIKKIRKKTKLELEAFIHGAMCVAVSGRCFLSHEMFGKSANRGECYQSCRREYEMKDTKLDQSIVVGSDYILSSKDLCTIGCIDRLIEAGIDAFKIEGRKRSPEYVAMVTAVYRKAIDLHFEKKLTGEIKRQLTEELKTVYNKGFTDGFYFQKPGADSFAEAEGNEATQKKFYAGKVLNYFRKSGIVHVLIETGNVSTNDTVLIIGPTTGIIRLNIQGIVIDGEKVRKAESGENCTFPCPEKARAGDRLYLLKKSGISV